MKYSIWIKVSFSYYKIYFDTLSYNNWYTSDIFRYS